uniref:F-box domain-containing protein n=1 Tax=Arundo donax TaxID=35708 RepID=A0A0A9FKZ2_ARUDO
MRTPLFSRNHKPRPPDACATDALLPIHRSRPRFAIAGKGSSQRRQLRSSRGDDRLSALPDDLLLLILRRLDTRTVLATAGLSKRWASLTRGLDTLSFRVSDILPPRYHRGIHLHNEASRFAYGFLVNFKVVCASIMRYERRAMRAMAASINNFLDADDDNDHGSRGLRCVRTLKLEFFATQCSSCMNRLIAKAVDACGVEDLEVSAKGTYRRQDAHRFPPHGLCKDPQMSRLRSLKLAACYIPQLQRFHALTTLVLQDLPESTPNAAYEAVFTLCPQLQSLHLKSCSFNHGVVAVHAPVSEIKQLIMEDCWYGLIKLYTLPMLESMAVMDTDVRYKLSSFPCLKYLNLTISHGITKRRMFSFRLDYDLKQYLGGTPCITDLIIHFTGYDRWFKLCSSTLLFPKLRRLLIADVPSSWDVSWPCLLIEVAPFLEILHVHITPWEEDPCNDISGSPPSSATIS